MKTSQPRVARLPSHIVEITLALHSALRRLAELDITETECWTIVDMGTDWGDRDAVCPVYTSTNMVTGSVKARLYRNGHPRYVLLGNPIRMLAWHTSTYWDTGDGAPNHEYSLWLALPEKVERHDFGFSTRVGTLSRDQARASMEIPKWAKNWVTLQERRKGS